MVQVLRLLRRLPVAEKIEDIAIFINRELLPFLQELRESSASTFEQITTNRLLGRDTPGTGDVEEISLDDTLEFTGSQSIQRAEITGDISIPAGSNVSEINAGVIVNADINSDANIAVSKLEDGEGLSVLGVAGSSDAQYDDITASVARHALRLNDAADTVEWGYPCFVSSDIAEDTEFDFFHLYLTTANDLIRPQKTDLGNGIAGLEFGFGETAAGDGLVLGPSGELDIGAGDGIDVAADTVSVDVTDIVDNVTITEVATNNIQRAALSGFTDAAAGSNATTSAEPIVTYSASANMSAERVLSAGTNTTISTAVANQISVNVAASNALIPDGDKGDITVSGTGSTWTIDNDVVTFAKMQDIGGRTVVCKPTTATGDATTLSMLSNSIMIREGANDLASLQITANSLIGRLGSGNIVNIASSAANQILLRGSGSLLFAQINDDEVLGVTGAGGTLSSAKIVTNMISDAQVTLPKMATQAAGTLVANVTAGAASPTAHSLSTLAGDGLTYTNVTGIMAVGAGTGITVNANDVQLSTIADDTFMANVSGGAAVATGKTFASLAGGGLTYDATNHELDVDATWADVLANGNNSGAFNPHIDSGQYIGFGTEGSLPIALATDIQHSGSLSVAAGTDITLTAGLVNLGSGLDGNILLKAGVSTGSVTLDAGADVNSNIELSAGNDIDINASGFVADVGTFEVGAQNGMFLNANPGATSNGFLLIGEASTATASTSTGDAGTIAYWAENTSPTRAKVTDDVGAQWTLGYACVSVNTTSPTATNATTNLSCGGSFSIPANTARAGTVYRLHGQYVYVHTAAATPTLTFEILIAGAVVRSVAFTPVSVASTYTGWFTATIRFQTVGAGGTCVATWIQNNDFETGVDQLTSSGHTGTEAVDTTIANAIELRTRMTTAVASNTLTVVQGMIERLA
jgi:hypothetical protein